MSFLHGFRGSVRIHVFNFILVNLALTSFAGKPQAEPGECALAFLNQPAGAYSASLGQANYAGTYGPEAIFGNPSLLGDKTGAFASHQELFLDTRAEIFSLSFPIANKYSIGAAARLFDSGKIDGYSVDNNKTGTIASGDRQLMLAISRRGNPSLGLSVSHYSQRLADQTGAGLGLGAGLTLDTRRGRFALTCEDIGPDFSIGDDKAPLPTSGGLSAWLPLFPGYLDFSCDLLVGRERGFTAAAGLEYRLSKGLNIRAGSGGTDRLAFGLGISSGGMTFDYSYLPHGIFGDRHILSFVFLK